MNSVPRGIRHLILCTLFVIGGALLHTGCGGDAGSNTNTNTITNTNANTNSGNENSLAPVVEATVTYPDPETESDPGPGNGLKVVAIAQLEGVSGNFFGIEDESETLTFTGFDGETSLENFEAEVGEELRTERVNIGDTEVGFTYHEDGSYDFEVNRGSETLFSGLNVPRPNAKQSSPSALITTQDIINCSDSLVAGFAEQVVMDLEGSSPGAEFVECLQTQLELIQLADMICVAELVLIPALENEEAECQSGSTCRPDLTEPALQISEFFAALLRSVLEDILTQIRQDALLCSTEEEDECQSDSECTDGQVCQDGNCVPDTGCSDNNDCPAGQVCEAGECVVEPQVSFEITDVVYWSMVLSDGPEADLEISWSGNPVFPVEATYRPTTDGCPAGVSCATPTATITNEENPIIFSGAIWCTGVTENTELGYEVVLTDDNGIATDPFPASFTCLPN